MAELLVIVFLSILNGILAMVELAVVSCRKPILEGDAQRGSRSAKLVLSLLQSPGYFLSTVQIGITLIGIVAGVFAGARMAGLLEPWIANIPLLASHAHFLAYVVVVVFITYLSLVLGELVPKQIAMTYPERVAQMFAPTIYVFSLLVRPVVWILDKSAYGILRLLGIQPGSGRPLTEEEIKYVVNAAATSGVIEEAEGQIAHKVLRLGDRTARSMMTSRTEVVWLDVNKDYQEIWDLVVQSHHSHYPVAEGSLDNTLGIVSVKDISRFVLGHGEPSLLSLLKETLRVPATLSALKILELFKTGGDRLALVVNEYGSVEGVLSLHDLTEAMVGDITGDEEDGPAITKREEGGYLVDASLSLEDLTIYLGMESIQEDGMTIYQSVGGLVLRSLGRMPKCGDSFQFRNFTFEVVDMDKNRVDKVLVTEVPQAVLSETEELKT